MATGDSDSLPGVPKTPVFATTRWTVVLAAAETKSPSAAGALEQLCRSYWYPLYAYARRRGHGPEEAKDLTQGFFVHLIEKKLYQSADRARGRFRTFLLSSLQNYLMNHQRDASAQKRGGGVPVMSLDFQDAEGRYLNEPVHDASPDKLFEREWACSLLQRVLERLRGEYAASGQEERFSAMSAHLVEPENATSYAVVAGELGLSEGAVKTAMHRLRRRYRQLYREEIAALVGSDEEVDEELRHMAVVLAD
jgi:RNA polymerase sigma factor (sigma-70 family)